MQGTRVQIESWVLPHDWSQEAQGQKTQGRAQLWPQTESLLCHFQLSHMVLYEAEGTEGSCFTRG